MLKSLRFLCSFFTILIVIQVPQFINLYQHELVGHVDELSWQIAAIKENASTTHKNIDQYIDKFVQAEDLDFSHQGALMKKTVNRFERLKTALMKLQNSTFFTKPFLFIFYLDKDIFESTLNEFTPGLTLSLESIYYGFCGLGFSFLLFSFLTIFWKKGRRLGQR